MRTGNRARRLLLGLVASASLAAPALAADRVASTAFGAQASPAALPARAIGAYAKGCLAGAVGLPATGPGWQVMRPSRNRAWAHPAMIAFLKDLAKAVPKANDWPGLLIGDISQPRGGPMTSGHASHQLGLDADIWLTPMPARILSPEERETLEPLELVRPDGEDVVAALWTPAHLALIRAAASRPRVERIFVNAAIKKALCRDAVGDRGWLRQVRPYFGHTAHMHVRLACPKGETSCEPQVATPPGDGCGSALDWWFTEEARRPSSREPAPPLHLSSLPAACLQVLEAP